jgi:hypothetical protein
MRPIWSHFGLRRPKVEINEAAEACQKAFGIVCFFIGTRDLIQEHIAFRVGSTEIKQKAACGELGDAKGDCHQVRRR